jgi:transcription termination factor Rho
VTDIQEQASAAQDAPAKNGAAPARAKRSSLSSMLLPELQQLASGMGINTAKLKKSDLVAAIKAAQGGTASASSAGLTAAQGADPAAPAATSPRTRSTARSRTRGAAATAKTDAPPTDAPPTDAPAAPAEPAATSTPRNGVDTGAESAAPEQRPASDQPQRTRQRDRDQNRDQARDARDTREQNRDQSQPNQAERPNQNRDQRGSAGQPAANQPRDDDDFDGGRRRGRRYRDRRNRNRERVGGPQSGATPDIEPTVSEDDVLIPVAGILDAVEEKNTWFVRTSGYYAGPDDVYVANSYVRRFNLRRGDAVTGAIRQPREGERREKYNPLVRLDSVNGRDPEQAKTRVEFTKLTPLYPQQRLRLETEPHILTTRVIDLVMPIGKGQRALIVSPPKAGKTMVLQAIANAIATNNPEVHLMVVLVDERPEEVTDMQRSVKGEVIASTFDRKPVDHTMVAELSIERAKRLVELGHDVVVLLDSITRLGRAYNLAAPASGRILSGGVDSTALYPPKRFLGAARNIENGGSLTILATALVETGSAGDTVIFEEFKGTGNAELKLDRKIADKRVFPAVDVDQSSTRKEEILLSPDELSVTIKLRRVLHALEPQQAIDLLLDRLKKTRTNYEFLMQIAKTAPGQD